MKQLRKAMIATRSQEQSFTIENHSKANGLNKGIRKRPYIKEYVHERRPICEHHSHVPTSVSYTHL